MEAFILRILLALYGAGGFALALVYMRYRRASLGEFAFWGMVALVLPVFGPFLVIAARPGPRKRTRRPVGV